MEETGNTWRTVFELQAQIKYINDAIKCEYKWKIEWNFLRRIEVIRTKKKIPE